MGTLMQPQILSRLRAVRQLAKDRNDAERLKEVVGALRRMALSDARMQSLRRMRFGSESLSQAIALLDRTKVELSSDPETLVGRASDLSEACERIRMLDAAACTELNERLRSYVDLSRKFQLQVGTGDLHVLVNQFTEWQVRAGSMTPQLSELFTLSARMADLYYDVTASITGHLSAIFGPNVELNAVRQLMGEGLTVTTLKPPQWQRLLNSKLAPSLVIRLK